MAPLFGYMIVTPTRRLWIDCEAEILSADQPQLEQLFNSFIILANQDPESEQLDVMADEIVEYFHAGGYQWESLG
jgi:hypothetical protein